MTQISRMYGQAVFLAMIPVVIFSVVQLFRYRREIRVRGRLASAAHLTAELIAVGNVLAVAVLTLTPGYGDPRSVNLIPLREVYQVWLDRGFYSAPVHELYINLGLFVPFAAAARFAWPALRTFRHTLGAVALISILIESLQYGMALGRVASATDVVLPVAGAGLAWAVVDMGRQFYLTCPSDEFVVNRHVR